MWPCSSHAGHGGISGPLLTVPLIRGSGGPTQRMGLDCEDSPYFRCRNMDEIEAMRLFGVGVRFSARDRPAAASGFGSSDDSGAAPLCP